mmetsp:Transcript_14701/g.42851  ORF Transcript_14701/g.42851 Transcript_14701/m.42851 type:complete len:293 (-) Transcript_14701:442-1320(-)
MFCFLKLHPLVESCPAFLEVVPVTIHGAGIRIAWKRRPNVGELLADRHLRDGVAKAEHVEALRGFSVVPALPILGRRHPSTAGHEPLPGLLRGLEGRPEVHELHEEPVRVALIDHDVLGLEVVVDDHRSHAGKEAEALCELPRDDRDVHGAQHVLVALVVIHPLVEVPVPTVFQDQIHRRVPLGRCLDVVVVALHQPLCQGCQHCRATLVESVGLLLEHLRPSALPLGLIRVRLVGLVSRLLVKLLGEVVKLIQIGGGYLLFDVEDLHHHLLVGQGPCGRFGAPGLPERATA